MGILAINVNTTGLVGDDVRPQRCTIVTTDNLATITTAGYLNAQNTLGHTISPSDIFDILYSYNINTKASTFGIFTVTYSQATGFTLVDWSNSGNVLLPVVNGDFAVFNGTTGQIKDSGAAPSSAQPFVAMSTGGIVANHLLKAGDANGTIADQGVQMKTVAQAAVAGGAAAQTVTDAFCTAASMVVASWNDTTNAASIQKVTAGVGSFVVTSSADPGASHLNYIITKV